MHFHLPKPLHGWREFVGEVGIIVVGVLIALGAEQVVEMIGWRDRANSARQSLHGELTDHYENAVEWRTVEPCIDAQLDRLEAGLMASGNRVQPATAFHERESSWTFALRVPRRPYADSVWQSVLAEGVSSHLAEADRITLGLHYREAHDVDELNKRLTDDATKLKSLTRPIALDASSRLSMLQSIDDARYTNDLMGLMSGQLVGFVTQLRMVPAKPFSIEQSGTALFCRAHHLPLRAFSEATKPLR
jgi:hypothetical protein